MPRVFVHVITDGRDASPTGSVRYVAQLEEVLDHDGTGRIATVVGRYYAMDRDKRWDRTQLAYDAIVGGVAEKTSPQRRRCGRCTHTPPGVTDEFIRPVVIVAADGAPVGPIRNGDSVIFFNFRADRARQMTRAIALNDFDGFERPARPIVHYTTMTMYDRTFDLPVVFDPQALSGNFADVLASQRPLQPAARRDREVRARHLLLQLRTGGAVCRRGSDPGPLTESGDVRPDAGDERAGDCRRAGD